MGLRKTGATFANSLPALSADCGIGSSPDEINNIVQS